MWEGGLGGTLGTIGIAANLASFAVNLSSALVALGEGRNDDFAESFAWATLDALFLAIPGSSLISRGGAYALAGGGRIAASHFARIAVSSRDIIQLLPVLMQHVDIRNFDYNRLLRKYVGAPPPGISHPHAHHILQKIGNGADSQKLVEEGQEILRRFGIDPIFGPENLIWAPMRVEGQHGLVPTKKVVDALKAVEESGGSYDDIVNTLRELGEEAARRGG